MLQTLRLSFKAYGTETTRQERPFPLRAGLIVCLLLVPYLQAATYYLDPVGGDNANSGDSQAAPWQTMVKVSSASQPGDSVFILRWNDALSDAQWPFDRLYYSQSVYRNSITWTFTASTRIGQFVNGDFWAAGPVSITAIDPAAELYVQTYNGATSQVTIHGSMVNPANLIHAPDSAPHAFDQRISGWNQALLVKTPVTLQPEQSLITVRSWKLSDPGCPSWNTTVRSPRPALKHSAILTALASPPANPMFRPAYCGDTKAHHYLRDMDLSLLPNLTPVPATPAFDTLFGTMKRTWAPDLPCSWLGDYVHPSEHMPNYGRNLTAQADDIALALLLNEESMIRSHGYPADWKQRLAVVLIQFGIDSYGIVQNGGGWGWVGGGIGQGRKWPILFAGLVFDDPGMKNIGATHGLNLQHRHFMDDAQVFYLSQEDVDRFPLTVTRTNCRVDASDPRRVYDDSGKDWSISDNGTVVPYKAVEKLKDYWLLWDVGGANQLVRVWTCEGTNSQILYMRSPLAPGKGKTARLRLFAPERLGLPEWGERHMNKPQNDYYSRGYRTSTTGNSLAGAHLSALALRTRDGRASARELWNWPAFFDYMDMYMQEDFEATWHRQWSRFAEQMWDTYRPSYGPIWPDTQPPTTPGNKVPVLAYIGDRHVVVGQTVAFTVTASDADGDAITFSAAGLPAGATFAEQTFNWTPASNQVGSHQVTFTASDGKDQDSETVTITVETSNTPPVLAAITDRSIREGETLTFSVSAADAEGDPITYSATGLPNGASLAAQTFTWTPSYSQAGSYEVTFTASDGLAQDSQTITIAVTNVNRPPSLAAIGDRSVDQNGALTFDLSAVDPDGDSITYSAAGLPSGANLTGGTFNWASAEAGSYEITFTASDGELTDSETITVAVVAVGTDQTAPVVARHSPAPDAIQVPLNSLVTLYITDAGQGVDADSVTIAVDDNVIYQGGQESYASAYGQCNRSGTRNDYRFTYQPNEMFDFDHVVTVRASAADLAGNVMNEYTYSFVTEMRVFGSNKQVSKSAGSANKQHPVTARDAAGGVWAAWHAGAEGSRDIYVARLAAGAEAFDSPTRLTTDPRDQCHPDLAAAADGSLYVVWQDNRQGHWDIYASVCSDGVKFSREVRVSDSNDNEIRPAIAIDGQAPSRVLVAWQDDRNGNQDIYVAATTNAFAGTTISPVTTNAADQMEPAIAIDGQNTVYLAWTDMRNGQPDIYGAASNSGPWANVPVVTGAGAQTEPALAAEPGGSRLHLAWVDDSPGDRDIYYARLDGLPGTPVVGGSVIDDTSGADQSAPAIACSAHGKVFACWEDSRHVGTYGSDTDLYLVELSAGTVRTNVLVGDEGTSANQSEPALGVNRYGEPYVVWADDRSRAPEIYYAATTFIDPEPLDTRTITASVGGTVGTEPEAISKIEDVSIVVPPGACQANIRVSISRIVNPQVAPVECLGSYDFGPSGIDFDQPVTVTIPYYFSGGGRARAYWYDSLTGAMSQQGITDIEHIALSSHLNALRFKTTHFTPFYLVAGESDADWSWDFGGGCSLSPTGGGSPGQLLVPYALIAAVMAILRRTDRTRARRSRGE